MEAIKLRGARVNNLRGVDLSLSPGTLTVVRGPSGAGKSSLVFATLYAEGQRRYVESFSPYARQFLERLARPPLDALEAMPAAIAIDRAGSVKTSRSTVSTMTELSDYLKQLWALAAELDCTDCGERVRALTPEAAAERVQSQLPDARIVVSYPQPVLSAEDYLTLRERLLADGYRRAAFGATVRELETLRPSEVLGQGVDGEEGATLDVVVDRLTTRASEASRLVEALEAAFEHGAGHASVASADGGQQRLSRALICDGCGKGYAKPAPGLFSFNSPVGACERCRGFGRTIGVDWDKVFPDPEKTLAAGAIKPWSGASTAWERKLLKRFCKRNGIPMDAPLAKLGPGVRAALLEGDGGNWDSGFPGLERWFEWLESRAYKMHVRVLLARYRRYEVCEQCQGSRFRPEVHGWKLGGRSLPEVYAMSVTAAADFVAERRRQPKLNAALSRVLEACHGRLSTLIEVGLGYLSLDRTARSLSGGELQRVALTSALGSGLSGMLFALDEPTVGLHPADVERLLPAIRRLSDRGNVVVVVDSDAQVMASADRVVELGPGAGAAGGRIVFDGPVRAARRSPVVAGAPVAAGRARRSGRGTLLLRGARGHNLDGVDLAIPLGVFSCITGVSGSGKSSLVTQTLLPALARAKGEASAVPLAHDGLTGAEAIKRVVVVDQAPLGRTSRGNPATYVGAWDGLRKAFAGAPLARERGYTAGFFSFNVAGGRCEACKGEGSETVEMQFLADVRFSCPECGGRRFAGPVLDVEIDGLTVADALELSVDQAIERFASLPRVAAALKPLSEVGAGYLLLGQPLSTLSGGEAQRLRLAAAIGEATEGTLLSLDEPTAGLHESDIAPLLSCLERLVDEGSTVVVVEHAMELAAHADHVVDLGPGSGARGGRIVAQGSPEEVTTADTATAPYLARALSGRAVQPRPKSAGPRGRTRTKGDGAGVIEVRNAREHNLQNISLELPRDRLVVVTGPSGSGKSTLAFDVIFAESQRRYLETLSPYVRQYIKELPRPDVEAVVGIPPGVSLEQRHTGGARNSTVATVTEVAHYLRLVFARAGTLYCEDCEVPIEPRPAAGLVADVRRRFPKGKAQVLSPIVRAQKGAHRDRLERARSAGFMRARIDGAMCDLTAGLKLDRYREHDVDVVIGEAAVKAPELTELLERALLEGSGTAHVVVGRETMLLSSSRSCASCGRGYPDPDPRFFSFNTRQGACAKCEGRGMVEVGEGRRKKRGRKREAPEPVVCPDCQGVRLAGIALHTQLGDKNIAQLMALDIDGAFESISKLELSGRAEEVAKLPLREALGRLGFLQRVGLGYLNLDRAAHTLSGGELQRVRLAAQLGSGLTGVLYVLDEPTIGLHVRDTGRLLEALKALRTQGSSVLVVEHDADTIAAADHVIDVGPSGGQGGGRIVAQGPPRKLLSSKQSVTGRSLAAPPRIPDKRRKVKPTGDFIEVVGARQHNLRDVHLKLPVGRLSVVTGVSGSGKSTLVREVMLRGLRQQLGLKSDKPGAHDAIHGSAAVKRAIEVDQTPIGRTPRSVPATYVGIWDEVRRLYAHTPQARARGYDASRFSFNVAKGRCGECEGQGASNVEMSFLPDALVPCESCDGMRFNPETLAVRLHGLHIGQLLQLHVEEVAELLSAFPKISRPLQLMGELGMGYLTLGQPSNTLSGGEAQRMKLVSELATASGGSSLYVLDEPTTGLHRQDVWRLLDVLGQLVDRGDTLVLIEHHPDVIAAADWVVDLGPEGGRGGGRIVAQGTPEKVARSKRSHTGRMLAGLLGA
ncbi:MAG: excinuclease ABC subunit UvrA [Myxococcales bacterium]|nr:excinuclease ABC subunit UvrA [Myxococcales bacterium]